MTRLWFCWTCKIAGPVPWFGSLTMLAALSALLAFPLLFTAGQTEAKRPLIWASDAEGGAPYIFKSPKNLHENIGFEVDISNALAQELKREIQFKQYSFQTLIAGLERGEQGDFDFAMNGIEVTPERKQQVRFSRPYYIYKLQLVVRAEDHRFQTLEQCRVLGCKVGTMEDTAAERLLSEMKIHKASYDAPVQAYDDLAIGRIDAVLMDLPIAIYYAQPRRELKFAGEPLAKGFYAIAFSKRNEALAAEFDAALERLLKNGTLQRIYEKWNLWNDDQNELLLASVADITGESGNLWTFRHYFPLLWDGAQETIKISILSMGLAIILGLLIALARLYGPAPLPLLATAYVEFFRGIPVLILLFFLYYGLPEIAKNYSLGVSLDLGPLGAAVLGFGLNYAAYEAEIYRAAISSIPVGQWEAAVSLGMSGPLTFRRIILPQAIRIILPPMTNDFVALFKDTSIVSIIAVVELSKQYQILSKSSSKYLEIGLATAALYLVMSVPLGHLSRYLEKRWSKAVGGSS
jgi:polar amino acid transport system substrate-binding protein